MAFSLEEQVRLGDIYAPILFLRKNDVAPISPAEYIRRSALWSFPGPVPIGDEQDKQSWGTPVPALMPGMLAASADDSDVDERTLLWTQMSEASSPAFFLDHGGWDNQDRTSAQPLPSAGEATGTSSNLMGSVGQAVGRWDYRQESPPLDQHIGWYSVQAFDTASGSVQLRDTLNSQFDPAADHLESTLSALPRLSWLVFYHFFFPACWERVDLCELRRTLWALGIDFESDLAPAESIFPEVSIGTSGIPYSSRWAAYLGEFVSVAVVVPAPPPEPTAPNKIPGPLEIDESQFEQPLYVGFGRSVAGLGPTPLETPIDVPKMMVASPSNVQFDGNHVRVFVSEGNHNLYPEPGLFTRPRDEGLVSICDWADVPSAIPGTPTPPVNLKELQANVIPWIKFLTHGLLGALILSLLERAAAEWGKEEGTGMPGDEPQEDDLAEQDSEGLILAPEELTETFMDDAEFVRPWAGTAEQRVFDENWDVRSLSWGPPTLQDPFQRRQGRPMSRFIGPFISELGSHLEENG